MCQVILNEVIARFGCPYDIHSDQGGNYENTISSKLCHLLEMQKTRLPLDIPVAMAK